MLKWTLVVSLFILVLAVVFFAFPQQVARAVYWSTRYCTVCRTEGRQKGTYSAGSTQHGVATALAGTVQHPVD